MRKTIAFILICVMLSALFIAGCGTSDLKNTSNESKEDAENVQDTDVQTSDTNDENANDDAAQDNANEEVDHLTGVYKAEISIKDYGIITIEMDADKAPITVTNFVQLVESGFYDGLTWHRIIDGFMMQGGDPTGTGFGGSDNEIKGEFEANGIANDQSHTRGAVSMARSQAMDSASSQFFIVHQDSDFLDGQYACFGYVTDGMDVVDQICEDTPVEDSNGTVLPENQPVIEYIKIIE